VAGVEIEAAVGPGEEEGKLAVGQGAGAVESFENGLSPEIGDGLPTAGGRGQAGGQVLIFNVSRRNIMGARSPPNDRNLFFR